MRDTSPEIDQRYIAMLMARSGEERLKMGCSKHSTTQALVKASVLEKDPLASPAALRRALFLRFYGHEFDADATEKILVTLSHCLPATRGWQKDEKLENRPPTPRH